MTPDTNQNSQGDWYWLLRDAKGKPIAEGVITYITRRAAAAACRRFVIALKGKP